jgi:anti-anti-sigma regulatory factor
MAINLELGRGRHGASARIELGERCGKEVARVVVRGRIDRVSLPRLVESIVALGRRGVRELVLDGSTLTHIDGALVAPLIESLAPFTGADGSPVLGLSRRLGRLFRLAAREPRSADRPAALPASPNGPPRECAS